MTAPFKLTAPLPTEDQEAAMLIEWAHVTRWRGARLSELLVMIPNGAQLAGDARQRAIQMGKMKRMGFRAGCYDYFLAVPPGCWIELKRTKLGVVSSEQEAFGLLMNRLGWRSVICKGWEEASRAIQGFLAQVSDTT